MNIQWNNLAVIRMEVCATPADSKLAKIARNVYSLRMLTDRKSSISLTKSSSYRAFTMFSKHFAYFVDYRVVEFSSDLWMLTAWTLNIVFYDVSASVWTNVAIPFQIPAEWMAYFLLFSPFLLEWAQFIHFSFPHFLFLIRLILTPLFCIDIDSIGFKCGSGESCVFVWHANRDWLFIDRDHRIDIWRCIRRLTGPKGKETLRWINSCERKNCANAMLKWNKCEGLRFHYITYIFIHIMRLKYTCYLFFP